MRQPPHGNGSGKINIHQDDMAGWVRVHTDKLPAIPEDLSLYLSLALTEWFRQRPQLTMVCVVPVVRDGSTIELHGWYTQHVFPDLSSQTPPEPSP